MLISHSNVTAAFSDSSARISIIIVTYNAAADLQKCLDSIYAQTCKAIDIIVIDGDSTDGTIGILKKNTPRIYKWISEKDTGIYNAMNKALKYISGKWVYFLGSDDQLLPGFSKLASELTDVNAIYYANVLHNGKIRSGNITPYYMAKVGVYHQAIIYPKAVFEKYSYNEKYQIAADYALNMKCYHDDDFHFVYNDYIIANYNHTGISATVIDSAFEKDKSKLILANFGRSVWLRFVFRQLKGAIIAFYRSNVLQ